MEGIMATNTQNYSNIADAIRAKSGTDASYKPAEMAAAIAGIESGAAFNIAYGDTAPEDTTKLWVKCAEPVTAQVTAVAVTAGDALAENHLLIEANGTDNVFSLLPEVAIGVKNVYLGNSEGVAEKVEAYVYSLVEEGTSYAEFYTSSAATANSGTELTASVDCNIGDLVIAAIATRDTTAVSNGWTLLSTSDTNSLDDVNQRLSWAYKFAESGTESITVTQASEQRIYINMVALQGATGVIDNGYHYCNDETSETMTVSKPDGLTLWGFTCPYWYGAEQGVYKTWQTSNDSPIIQLSGAYEIGAPRLGVALDQSDDITVTFTPRCPGGTTMIVGSLTVEDMEHFYAITPLTNTVWKKI